MDTGILVFRKEPVMTVQITALILSQKPVARRKGRLEELSEVIDEMSTPGSCSVFRCETPTFVSAFISFSDSQKITTRFLEDASTV